MTAAATGFGLADVGQGLGVNEHGQGLLQLGQVVQAEDDRGGLAMARHRDPFVLALDPVDDVAEVVSDLTQRSMLMATTVARGWSGHPGPTSEPFAGAVGEPESRSHVGNRSGCAQSATVAHMPTIAARDLRNHTATVLEGVARGEVYTVTVHGRPVAEMRRVARQRRAGIPRDEVIALLERQRPDPTFAQHMAWISEGLTDDLDDLD